MNTRVLYIIVGIQVLFAISLIVIGTRARDSRKQEYLELTNRVTSGYATEEEFAKLAGYIPAGADAQTVRSLFGAPLQIVGSLIAGDETLEPRTGKYWIYYVAQNDEPVDPEKIPTLKGKIRCFVVEFNEQRRARGKVVWVQHPIEPSKSTPPIASPGTR
jgi:hypothetical protein